MEACLVRLTSWNEWLLELQGLLRKVHSWDQSSTDLRELPHSSWHAEILVKPWNAQVWNLWSGSESRQNLIQVLAPE